MFPSEQEQAFLSNTHVGKTVRSLLRCGCDVFELREEDGPTSRDRIGDACLSMMKLCALALSIRTDEDGQICKGLDSESDLEFDFTQKDIERTLCATIALFEHGRELAEASRVVAMDEYSEEQDEAAAEAARDASSEAAE